VLQKFRRLPGFSLHFACWGSEFAVYHEGSGNTHLLDEYGHAVLECLQASELSLSDIVSRTAAALNIEMDYEFDAHIREVVRHLLKHDLLEVSP